MLKCETKGGHDGRIRVTLRRPVPMGSRRGTTHPVRCRVLVRVGLGAGWACATEISGRIAIATVHTLDTLRPLPGQAQETLPEPAKPVPRVVRRQRQSAPAAPAATRAL